MKRYCIIVIFLLQIQAIFGQVDKIRQALVDRDETNVMVVSHRGEWRQAPENSLKAIELAIEAGVDIVEIDIAKTKDGQLILMHDKTLDRTTTGKGNVAEWTLDSLTVLKLKNGAGLRTHHSIPTLEEALLLAKGRVMLNLDKAYDLFDEVYELLEKTNTVDHIIMKGNKDVATVKRQFGRYLDKVIYMPIVNLDKPNAKKIIDDFNDEINPVAFELVYKETTNKLPLQLAYELKGKNLLWYNTLWDTLAGGNDDDKAVENPDASYGYLVNTLNARIIQTDRSPYLITYLKKINKK
ncbi:glycerophosphodiester phosphodiesterase family protein [Sphingobacterium chuzhouense]|uniref:Glycerophosphodiester phosphodiesterase family protein n=1 Tax=Sphingobacterium chuzhouense TaxID=1742264 RepID=A0ABR7XN89_9SPHI|nr:glycerophosphodiester phosphodiesterase family protein [Sphingobacterium chuzhouense]MBD1420644.1 glycerophosphodiester phosphodiesterase family protein [Sphingobacterium chuzhouense]